MSILQVTELKKHYGSEPNITNALDGVSLSIEEGEFVAIVETSGSGKSTLLHRMGGLDVPTSGSVAVRGKELAQMSDEQLTISRRRNIGFFSKTITASPFPNPPSYWPTSRPAIWTAAQAAMCLACSKRQAASSGRPLL